MEYDPERPNARLRRGKGAKTACCNETECPWTDLRNQVTSVDIGDGVESIERYAFYMFTELQFLTIGDSVRTIDDYAFYNCSSLSSVTFPSSLEIIQDHVFEGCNKLETVDFPSDSNNW